MIPVDPSDITTLILDGRYIATGRFMTARAALRKMMNGQVKGWDAAGNIATWDGTDRNNLMAPASTLNWVDQTVELHPDQPCLRSSPNALTGEETRWPIPTIVVCTRFMGTHQKAGESISLKKLHKLQKGECQYCGTRIPLSEATKDHIYPKSAGGSNDDFNLVLACRKCNQKKADTFPFYDKDGKIPRPPKRGVYADIDTPLRREWLVHLHRTDENSEVIRMVV